ncbi:hypothetical protein N8156_03380 [Rhodospirillaceae bacterium]|jgi:hypothetical protein|nr:hypothetical protein [Rhodospirillaceae bacterium]|tara:strand:+ start:364 stop:561 length:198 start_codon:yes stop_codon:yes gene_type:complete
MPPFDDKRVIIEFIKVGAYVKVSAIDPLSSVEVSIVGDPASSQERLKSTVLKKLNFVLSKRIKQN